MQGIFPTQGVNLRLLGRLFPTQGLNLRLLGLLPWQVDSLPLSHLESLHVGYTCFNMCLAQYSQIVSMGMAIRERSGAVEKVHFHFHQEAFEFFFTLCHKGGGICISEVINISPGNLDSSLCFFQPSVSHDVLCI